MALPSQANSKPVTLDPRPIDLMDPRFKERIDVSDTASIPLVFTNNWLINYVHALEVRMGNLPNVEILEKYGPQITSLTDLSLNSANSIVVLQDKDKAHDASLKAVNDNITAFKAQHTIDVKAINDKATADVRVINDRITVEVKAINDKATKDRADLVAADAADKKALTDRIVAVEKALTDRIVAVEKASNDSDSKHTASIAQHTAQIKLLQDASASTNGTLGTLSDAVLQANTAASKANTDLIAVKTDTSNVKLKLTELAAEVKAASQAAQSSIPTGTIIDWLGGFYNLDVPAGFWPCDGTVINDPTSVLNGKKAPDLREVYTAGAADGKGSGTILGSNTYNLRSSDLPKVKYPNQTINYTPSGYVSVVGAGSQGANKFLCTNASSIYYTANNGSNTGSTYRYPNADPAASYWSLTIGDHGHSASFTGTATSFTVVGIELNTGAQTAIDMRPKTFYVTKLIKI